jgi:transposase
VVSPWATGQGKSLEAACKEAGISEQRHYSWKKEYDGLKLDQAKKLKGLWKSRPN